MGKLVMANSDRENLECILKNMHNAFKIEYLQPAITIRLRKQVNIKYDRYSVYINH